MNIKSYNNSNFNFIKFPKQLNIKPFNKSGRSFGTITCRHKEKFKISKMLQILEFNYANYSINAPQALVIATKVDYKRHCLLSLIMYINSTFKGKKRVIIQTDSILIGDILTFTTKLPCKKGSSRELKFFPIGSLVHNLEETFNKGAKLARTGGTFAKIIFHKFNSVIVKLPSGQYKLLDNRCYAVLGITSKISKYTKNMGYYRKIGIRPIVRGVAMNSIDHPHGGGEGKSSVGLKTIKTPWGKYNSGVLTRKINKIKSNYIIKI